MKLTSDTPHLPCVLIIDDKLKGIDKIKKSLLSLHLDVIVVSSCLQATLLAKSQAFSMILFDINSSSPHADSAAKYLNLYKSTNNTPKIIFIPQSYHFTEDYFESFTSLIDVIYHPTQKHLLLNKVKLYLQLWQLDKNIIYDKDKFKELAYKANHDIKGPLRQMAMLSQAVIEDSEANLNAESCKNLQYISNGASRLAKLVDSLLLFFEVDFNAINLNTVELDVVVADVIGDLDQLIVNLNARLVVDKLPVIKGDFALLYQVFFTLLNNALHYQSTNTIPVIKIKSKSLKIENNDGFCFITYKKPFEQYISISVEDNGIGFDNKYRDKVFEPLQRLVSKDAYEGSGLGLSTIKKIIEHHNGTITCVSNLGEGVTFTINLPLDGY